MHSSGMHTTRLLTVSQHALCVCVWGVSQHVLGGGGCVYPSMHWAGEGVYPSMHWAGVSAQGTGVSAQGGGVCPIACWDTHTLPGQTPPPRGQTYTCEKHNLRKLRLRAVIRESVKGTDSCTSRSLFLFRTSVNGSA